MRRSLDSLGNSPNPLRCVLMQIERFSLMQGKPYLSVATATFLSEGDFEGFKTKATTFNSEKALATLNRMVKETFQSFEMMMRNLCVRCLFGSMKVEKHGKTAKSFGLLGSNTKTITSPKPHLFEESVFSTGATVDEKKGQWITFSPSLQRRNRT